MQETTERPIEHDRGTEVSANEDSSFFRRLFVAKGRPAPPRPYRQRFQFVQTGRWPKRRNSHA